MLIQFSQKKIKSGHLMERGVPDYGGRMSHRTRTNNKYLSYADFNLRIICSVVYTITLPYSYSRF